MANEIIQKKQFKHLLFLPISFTYFIAHILKSKATNHAHIIKSLNRNYFILTSILVMLLWFYTDCSVPKANYEPLYKIPLYLLFYYSFSRVNEVFIAFYNDIFDKLNPATRKENGLDYFVRIKLALNSYVELIMNYGILYFLLDFRNASLFGISFGFKEPLLNIGEAIYFSGVTIVTLGYGDISPTHWATRLLSLYEVINGMLLLVVCFTIYTSLNFKEKEEEEKNT